MDLEFFKAWTKYKRRWTESMGPGCSGIDPDARRRALRAFRAGWKAAFRLETFASELQRIASELQRKTNVKVIVFPPDEAAAEKQAFWVNVAVASVKRAMAGRQRYWKKVRFI